MAYLASIDDIMAPMVWSTSVTSFPNGVWRTGALSCVSITVVAHMTALTGYKEGQNARMCFSLHFKPWLLLAEQHMGDIKYINTCLKLNTIILKRCLTFLKVRSRSSSR